MLTTSLAEHRLLPDWLIRMGIRRMLRGRLREAANSASDKATNAPEFAQQLRQSAVTIETAQANSQHYEVPVEFFQSVLGPRLKYSCGLWSDAKTLSESENAMLRLTCERAGIANGMSILELGCGWGSLTLWLAEQFPDCEVLAMSNSATQRKFIEGRCRQLGLTQVEVVTCDVAEFDTQRRFDRVVSVEMFEHVRNYQLLFEKIASWLKQDGQLFAHIFSHRKFGYLFHTDGAQDWMGRHFFAGGVMPCTDLFDQFNDHLTVDRQWWISGTHYARTCEAWLDMLDSNRDQALSALSTSANPAPPRLQVQRWRMFFMACARVIRVGRRLRVGRLSLPDASPTFSHGRRFDS